MDSIIRHHSDTTASTDTKDIRRHHRHIPQALTFKQGQGIHRRHFLHMKISLLTYHRHHLLPKGRRLLRVQLYLQTSLSKTFSGTKVMAVVLAMAMALATIMAATTTRVVMAATAVTVEIRLRDPVPKVRTAGLRRKPAKVPSISVERSIARILTRSRKLHEETRISYDEPSLDDFQM